MHGTGICRKEQSVMSAIFILNTQGTYSWQQSAPGLVWAMCIQYNIIICHHGNVKMLREGGAHKIHMIPCEIIQGCCGLVIITSEIT